jgi:NTP pyrophosphatase (non-canonical NTP hydrolase)
MLGSQRFHADDVESLFRDLDADPDYANELNALRDDIHDRNVKAGWWDDLVTGERLVRNDGEMIALMHSELSEALEAVRKNLMDDKLTHRRGVEVEMADAIIRILDYCGGRGLDIGGAVVEKLAFNAQREDHKREHRLGANGKKI